MTEQEKRIGQHPKSPHFFSDWLQSEDMPATKGKKHRKTKAIESERAKAIEQIASWIILHHFKDEQIAFWQEKKREIYVKHDFQEYIDGYLPKADKTRKGNLAEIVLCEYLQTTSGLNLLVYKLRYNPNADQSIKGDDVLLFDKAEPENRIMFCESKFRGTPQKADIEEILQTMGGEVRFPISVTFIQQRLLEFGEKEKANKLADLHVKLKRKDFPVDKMHNIGFLMGNENAGNPIENHHLFGNFQLNKIALDALRVAGFPSDKIQNLEGRLFKNESSLHEAIRKKLIKEKVSESDAKNLIDSHRQLMFDNCDKSPNEALVFISLGLSDPGILVADCFARAEEILVNEIESLNPQPFPSLPKP